MSSTEPIAAELDAEAQLRQVRRENRTRRASAVMVLVLAVLTAGSALFPPFRDRMHLIHEVLPFIAVRAASTTSVLVAGGLVVAARGLRQGHRMAWLAGVSLLLYATGLHVIKGLDLEEAAVCLFGAGWLISHHRAFRVLPGWRRPGAPF